MHLLPASTVRLIASSQVITSVSSVVKELLENSLDAGASSIEIKLDGWGLERIEVRDNGCGIKPEDAPFMAQPHYTSKLTSDSDLKTLKSYGFRGEALGALCLVSSLSVLTKTATEHVGMLYTVERSGKIEATQPKPTSTGTTVIASNLFKNLPVRKQYSSGNKKCKEELKKIEDLVMAYGLVHPSLRIILRHNKTVVWQKNKVSDYRTALLTVLGTPVMMQMGPMIFDDAQGSGLHIVGYLPRPGADPDVTGRAINDRCFVYFNGRPVLMKQISQLIKQFYISHTNGSSNRFPVAFLNITLPPERLDVNLEPNKTSVMLADKEEVVTVLTNLLEGFYSDENKITPVDRSNNTSSCMQRKEKKLANGFRSIEETCKSVDKTSSSVDAADNIYLGNVLSASVQKDKMYTFTSLNRKPRKESQPEEYNSTPAPVQTKECEITSTDVTIHVTIHRVGGNNHINGGCTDGMNTQLDKTNGNNAIMDLSCYEGITEATNCSSARQTLQWIGHSQVSCGPGQGNTNHENPVHLSTSQTSNSKEHSFSDETLSNVVETEFRSNVCDSLTCSDKRGFQESNPDKNDSGAVVLLNDDDDECISINKSVMISDLQEAKDESMTKIDSGSNQDNVSFSSSRLSELFSIDLDDVFCDSDLDVTVANVSDKADTTLLRNDDRSAENLSAGKHVGVTGKASSVESSSVNGKLSTAVGKVGDKEWSMGHGLVDKSGHLIEPVALLTPGPSEHLQANIMTRAMPLRGKRKHPSNQENSRLSLSRKKIRKIPEITSQPLIRQLMSPNPLQRKLLSKKTNIPFCLNTLKESVLKRPKESRSVEQGAESHHLIGRLDPWGVWLMQQGTNLVCVNQYRIQERLLFHRLMSCHSLPKEALDHPVALSERTVGGLDCWRSLCGMSSKCAPPSTTRFIDDERITANGFDVCKRTDPDTGEIKVELLKVCRSIPFYGVPDLAETLGLTRGLHDGETNSLSSCRPLKVVNYLKGEAVRVARALSSRMSRMEVNEILSRMEEQLPEGTRTCIHDRPFYETIAGVSN